MREFNLNSPTDTYYRVQTLHHALHLAHDYQIQTVAIYGRSISGQIETSAGYVPQETLFPESYRALLEQEVAHMLAAKNQWRVFVQNSHVIFKG